MTLSAKNIMRLHNFSFMIQKKKQGGGAGTTRLTAECWTRDWMLKSVPVGQFPSKEEKHPGMSESGVCYCYSVHFFYEQNSNSNRHAAAQTTNRPLIKEPLVHVIWSIVGFLKSSLCSTSFFHLSLKRRCRGGRVVRWVWVLGGSLSEKSSPTLITYFTLEGG